MTRPNVEFLTMFREVVRLAKSSDADAVLLLVENRTDWKAIKDTADGVKIIVALESAEGVAEAVAAGMNSVFVEMSEMPVYDKISQTLLKAISEEQLAPGSRVAALYSGFEAGSLDSISIIDLDDHLGRLTVRDLQQLGTRVPLDTLQTVVNLALEIGREGREGKPVGTFFVVGDSARVRKMCHVTGFDPVKGYSRKERNLKSSRVREGIKEIAQMDGAIIVAADGTVEAAAQYVDASAADITLSKGLGARHWAAAAISRATKAVAVAVSESSGTVRIFQNGEVVLRIEPFRRPMKWKDYEHEPPGE
ncbi:MAG: DNA integrity scanning protein DisA nucleotide-binding domain protein [Planctomycetaceae bacterium]|nr:DNA integrity scanning protein DisA nucleotide-binding domain protein [Planctomycetaceae bacterium]